MGKERRGRSAWQASETDVDASESSADESQRGARHATVYDAVAGKVPNRDRRSGRERGPSTVKHSTKDMALGPHEVLFRRQGAPERYAEHDIYYANELQLPRAGQGVLPDSDLLKAIHSYSSHFYASRSRSRRQPGDLAVDERSMDETALLAFGILLEEAGREVLGRRGELVFTEAADDDGGEGEGEGDVDGSDAGASQHGAVARIVVGSREVGSRLAPRKRRRLAVPEPLASAAADDEV